MWVDENEQGRGERAELLSQCGLEGLVDKGRGSWEGRQRLSTRSGGCRWVVEAHGNFLLIRSFKGTY